MAPKATEMGLVLVLVLMLCNRGSAQTSCTNALMGLSPCLNFVTGSSATPSPSCCSQLSGVVGTQPQCLCLLINGGGAATGIAINQTLSLALPAACNVQTPPASLCNAAKGPTASAGSPAGPASAPVGSPSSDSTPSSDSSSKDTPQTTTPPTTPSQIKTPSSPAGVGSKTVPSTHTASSGGSAVKSPLHVAMFSAFIMSFALTATRF